MSASRESIIRWFYAKSDMLALVLAWLLAYALRFYGPFSVSKGIPDWPLYLKLTPFILIIWFSVFSMGGVYSRNKRPSSIFHESLEIGRLSFLALILFIAVSYFYEEYHYSRLTLALFAVLHPSFIFLGRSILRKILRLYRKRLPARKVLIIGSGPHLEKAFAIASSLELASFDLLGIMGLAKNEEALNYAKDAAKKRNCAYLEIPKDWLNFFQNFPCESILIALPNDSLDFLEKHLEVIFEQVSDVKVLPDLSYLDRFNSGIDLVKDIPLVHVHDSPLKGVSQLQKRVFDILGSLACIVLFSPLLILIAILVKLSSPGRVFYTQERMGLDGRTFPILKFRSMPENIEKGSGAVWAQKDDGRVTQLGKILRKTSLDELPQLFNVLLGQMSLVGPRPERPVFVSQFRRSVPGYMLRHKVKAGMTGWAQVHGWRGNTSIEKRIESDLHYIQNWSLWLDIKILFLTLIRGFINTNAY